MTRRFTLLHPFSNHPRPLEAASPYELAQAVERVLSDPDTADAVTLAAQAWERGYGYSGYAELTEVGA